MILFLTICRKYTMDRCVWLIHCVLWGPMLYVSLLLQKGEPGICWSAYVYYYTRQNFLLYSVFNSIIPATLFGAADREWSEVVSHFVPITAVIIRILVTHYFQRTRALSPILESILHKLPQPLFNWKVYKTPRKVNRGKHTGKTSSPPPLTPFQCYMHIVEQAPHEAKAAKYLVGLFDKRVDQVDCFSLCEPRTLLMCVFVLPAPAAKKSRLINVFKFNSIAPHQSFMSRGIINP